MVQFNLFEKNKYMAQFYSHHFMLSATFLYESIQNQLSVESMGGLQTLIPFFLQGKGEMNTYWLAGRDGEKRTKVICELLKAEKAKKMKTQYR